MYHKPAVCEVCVCTHPTDVLAAGSRWKGLRSDYCAAAHEGWAVTPAACPFLRPHAHRLCKHTFCVCRLVHLKETRTCEICFMIYFITYFSFWKQSWFVKYQLIKSHRKDLWNGFFKHYHFNMFPDVHSLCW